MMRLLIGTSRVTDMTTLMTSRAAAATAASPAGPPHLAAASQAVRSRDPMYQNGITRPSTRPPAAVASIQDPTGSRRWIGLTKTATANSTPTMTPTTVAVMTASVAIMIVSFLALLDFLALLT